MLSQKQAIQKCKKSFLLSSLKIDMIMQYLLIFQQQQKNTVYEVYLILVARSKYAHIYFFLECTLLVSYQFFTLLFCALFFLFPPFSKFFCMIRGVINISRLFFSPVAISLSLSMCSALFKYIFTLTEILLYYQWHIIIFL